MTVPTDEIDDEVEDARVRAWLREQGEDVPKRGRIRRELRDKYDVAHGLYDGGVTAADFGGDDDSVPGSDRTGAGHGHDGEAAPDMTERTPRGSRPRDRRRSANSGSRRRRPAPNVGNWLGKVRDAGKKKRGPWQPTSSVIEHFWSQLAWSARPIPPLQKILAAQAPMAGIALQDALRETWVDRVVLQPAARAEEKLQAVNAMIGPPVFTSLIAWKGGVHLDEKGRPVIGEDGMPAWTNETLPMIGGLRFSLMSWLKVADKHSDEIIESSEELIRLGDEADKLIAYIFTPPAPGQSPKDVEREAQRRGADFVRPPEAPPSPPGFAGATQDQVTGTLEQAARGALRPVPATGSRGQ